VQGSPLAADIEKLLSKRECMLRRAWTLLRFEDGWYSVEVRRREGSRTEHRLRTGSSLIAQSETGLGVEEGCKVLMPGAQGRGQGRGRGGGIVNSPGLGASLRNAVRGSGAGGPVKGSLYAQVGTTSRAGSRRDPGSMLTGGRSHGHAQRGIALMEVEVEVGSKTGSKQVRRQAVYLSCLSLCLCDEQHITKPPTREGVWESRGVQRESRGSREAAPEERGHTAGATPSPIAIESAPSRRHKSPHFRNAECHQMPPPPSRSSRACQDAAHRHAR